MKKTFYILIFFSFLKTGNAQTFEPVKATILLEYKLNPNKPKRKAELIDTFLIIKSESNKEINLEDYELKKYNVKVKAIPDTSYKLEIDGFVKSRQFKIQKGATFYKKAKFSENHISDSTYTTYAFLQNFDNKATHMDYYFTFDEKKQLVQYEADCYAHKEFVVYKYSDKGKLIQIDGNRHVTIEYEGKIIKRIYYHEWNSQKKQYYPTSFIEVKTDYFFFNSDNQN